MPKAAVHESTHFAEQMQWGLLWYAGYGAEIVAKHAYYGGDFWAGAHTASSFEQRANRAAGWQNNQPSEPWWRGLLVKTSDLLQQQGYPPFSH